MRVGCYVDGFNLYHATDDLGDPALKWLDLQSLARSFLGKQDTLVRTVFFTALNTWDRAKRQRHVAYVNALEATGVEVVRSTFDRITKHCRRNGKNCPFHEEKETDVALAIEVLSDCYERGIERVLLITSDSDHIPMVSRVRERFPKTIVYLIAPPKRLTSARKLGSVCSGVTELSANRLRQHQLPDSIRDGRGRLVAARPALYGPHR